MVSASASEAGDHGFERASQRRQHQLLGAAHPLHGSREGMAEGPQLEALAGEGRWRVPVGQGLDPRRQAGGERLVIANLLGQDRIHIHVRAESLQFLDLFGVAEHEPVGMEGRVQPGPVELGDIHAELQLGAVHRNEACGKQGCHLIIVVGLAGAM